MVLQIPTLSVRRKPRPGVCAGDYQCPVVAATAKRPRPRCPSSAGCLPTRRHDTSVREASLDGEHRAGGIKQDALGVGPQDQLADRSASAQADHDEICTNLVGDLDQVL